MLLWLFELLCTCYSLIVGLFYAFGTLTRYPGVAMLDHMVNFELADTLVILAVPGMFLLLAGEVAWRWRGSKRRISFQRGLRLALLVLLVWGAFEAWPYSGLDDNARLEIDSKREQERECGFWRSRPCLPT